MIRKQFLLLVGLLAATVQSMKMARELPGFQCQSAGLSCLDCGTLVMCVGDETLTAYEIRCAEDQVCGETSGVASCFLESSPEAQQCHCGGDNGKKPDAFDNTKYIMCFPDQSQVSVPCPENLVYSHSELTCIEPPTPTTPYTPTCEQAGFFPRLPECTSYFACFFDSTGSLQATDVFMCNSGQRFDESTGKCVPEGDLLPPVFQCGEVDGAVADTVECNAFHICFAGTKLGATLCCEEGKKFDPDTNSCSDAVADDKCPTVAQCIDMSTYKYACGGPSSSAPQPEPERK
ncbi:uncharacterized protein LOC119582013 [Penaeus monodon]|uniref:uncharacterized protein LOC119582013 n=1 Tax=Penaeus monodon TaxID=6687 RepID=UPI0018A6F19E|nr:uncharacterized protein LOC119582013 [Penaeus monodon]